MTEHKHLSRLDHVYIPNPIYFITTCTDERQPILARPDAADILLREWRGCRERHGWGVGRYVIMPDHVHFFCARMPCSDAGETEPKALSELMAGWKEWTAKGLVRTLQFRPPVWQREFFDHVLRSSESYAEKWSYVRDNPVRAQLVERAEDWPYQGFVDFDQPRR